jgi:hypothetical protein
MPETYPGVVFDAEGVCNLCRVFETRWGSWVTSAKKQAQSEEELQHIFDAARRKHRPYDAVVGISGGKDSSYSLYLCHKTYGLKMLAFTKDGGFLADDARKRIEKIVKMLGVPHFYCHDPLAPELSAVFMRKTGNFCAPCELSTFNLTAMVAREYDIPLIIMGTSSRTEAGAPKFLNPWDPWYFRNVMKGEHYKEQLRCSCYGPNYVLREGIARIFSRRRILLLPDYVEWDEGKISQLFQREFGLNFDEEHSDCWASQVARYLYRKKLGGNDPNVAKYSLFVRSGNMTRNEALERLSKIGDNLPLLNLDHFLKITGMTRQEFDKACGQNPRAYMGTVSHFFNAMRRYIRRQAI